MTYGSLAMACASLAFCLAAAPDENALRQRSVVSLGDTTRLQRVLAKAGRGEPIVVGTIGGSITAGAMASTEENRWANRVAEWWRKTFPNTPVRLVNAGIGATGSDLGAHRVQKDLLDQKPDFVVVEYAVNDGGSPICAQTFEGLVRQIFSAPNRPACMALYTMDNKGQNMQAEHERVARHYGLPAVSYRDALWPEVEAGRVAWKDIEADVVHPNDKGHALCADFITSLLEQVRANLPKDVPEPSPLPGPLTGDTFEHTRMLTEDNTKPISNNGWQAFPGHATIGPGWTASEPGSTLEFSVEGTCVSVVYYHVKGDVGMAEVQVDEREPVTLDAYFPEDWGGGYTPFKVIAQDLPAGRHTLRIRLLDKTHPDSRGHAFTVDAVCVAGVKD